MKNPTTIALVAPFSYQPFRSIRLLCDLLARELTQAGAEVITITPDSFFGDITQKMGNIHRIVAGMERLTLSPFLLRSKLTQLERKAKKLNRDFVVLLCDQSLGALASTLSGFRVLTFVSDLTAVRSVLGEFGSDHKFWQRFNQHAILSGLRGSTAYITPSHATADDLARYIPYSQGRTTVATLPLNGSISALSTEEVASRQALLWRQQNILPRRYILNVGSAAWYKNRPAVILMAAEIKKMMPTPPALVFAGEAPTAEELALVKKHDVEFYYFAETTPADLSALYEGAEFLLMPSFNEGFGWPALEALAAGTLLVITDSSSLGEYFGASAALVFETPAPSEIEAWAPEAAKEVAKIFDMSAQERAAMIDEGRAYAATFTPERFSQGLCEALAKLDA